MATGIGQTSQTIPAAVFDGAVWHLLFKSQDDSDRLLYVTSDDGGASWAMGPDTFQTTGAMPAIALVQNLLVAVFIANDPSNRILYSVLDLNEAQELRAWRFVGQVAAETSPGTFAAGSGGVVNLFFLANDNSGQLLTTQFTP